MDPLRSTVELKDDTVIVVLGASGDLAKKKTVRNPCLDFSAFFSKIELTFATVPSSFWPRMFMLIADIYFDVIQLTIVF